jgi:hypothetical protein
LTRIIGMTGKAKREQGETCTMCVEFGEST